MQRKWNPSTLLRALCWHLTTEKRESACLAGVRIGSHGENGVMTGSEAEGTGETLRRMREHTQVRAIRGQAWWWKSRAEGEKWCTQWGSQSTGTERDKQKPKERWWGQRKGQGPLSCVWPHWGTPQFQLFPHRHLESVSQHLSWLKWASPSENAGSLPQASGIQAEPRLGKGWNLTHCGPSLKKKIQNYCTSAHFTEIYLIHMNTLLGGGGLQERGLDAYIH